MASLGNHLLILLCFVFTQASTNPSLEVSLRVVYSGSNVPVAIRSEDLLGDGWLAISECLFPCIQDCDCLETVSLTKFDRSHEAYNLPTKDLKVGVKHVVTFCEQIGTDGQTSCGKYKSDPFFTISTKSFELFDLSAEHFQHRSPILLLLPQIQSNSNTHMILNIEQNFVDMLALTGFSFVEVFRIPSSGLLWDQDLLESLHETLHDLAQNTTSPVAVVSYSTAGIALTSYLSQYDSAELISKIILIGNPSLGAPALSTKLLFDNNGHVDFDNIYNFSPLPGDEWNHSDPPLIISRKVMPEALPRSLFFGPSTLDSLVDLVFSPEDSVFSVETWSSALEHRRKTRSVKSLHTPSLNILGIGVPTPHHLMFDAPVDKASDLRTATPNVTFTDGDGVVPFWGSFSSIAHESLIVKSSHYELLSNGEVMNEVIEFLLPHSYKSTAPITVSIEELSDWNPEFSIVRFCLVSVGVLIAVAYFQSRSRQVVNAGLHEYLI